MKCILLVRVSAESQSFDEQEKELFELARVYGYKNEDITSIATKESAIKLDEEERYGLNKMKELIETGEYDCVFAWEISRIARRKKILFSIQEYLQSRKIQLIIKEPRIQLLKDDGSIDEGAETIFTLYAQMSESEMRNKKERFRRAKQEGFNKGKYMGGKITLGYRVSEEGYWEIDEEGASIIRLIFDTYNSGNYSLTELGKEIKSRGYFTNTSLTSIKAEIYKLLRDEKYIGKRTNNNIYPQIIDEETFEKCKIRRQENKVRPKQKTPHLLTPLIRCSCGASYSVNLIDCCYTCRIKHNGVEKGLTHTPDINANMIESLAWYVALQEFHEDMVNKRTDAKEISEKEIQVLKQKITYSREIIDSTMKRRSELDDNYFVYGRFTKEKYEELTQKQNDSIKNEQSNIKKYKAAISNLEKQIQEELTFDDMLNSLSSSYENLKAGTDMETMQKIVRRYITQIRIEPVEDRPTCFYKKVIFETINDREKEKKMINLELEGLEDIHFAFSNTFYTNTLKKKAYFDQETTNSVPMEYMERLKRTRLETRKRRKKKL